MVQVSENGSLILVLSIAYIIFSQHIFFHMELIAGHTATVLPTQLDGSLAVYCNYDRNIFFVKTLSDELLEGILYVISIYFVIERVYNF